MQNETAIKNNPFGFGDPNVAYAQYFQGQSFLNGLVAPEGSVDFAISNVSFEPGCRNHWHIHHDGYQILLVTAGEGWYQAAGHPAQLLHAGDVVVIKAGIKHWHGATKDSWFTHLAITKGTSEWLAPVSDAEYAQLPARN
ncbi:cupin domain-containing protein [Limosilactobacillus ingluviei]